MRVLLILFVLISSASATSSEHVGITNTERFPIAAEVHRFLRRHYLEEEADIESDDEDRGGLDKVDDLITKVDDALGITGKMDDVAGKLGKVHVAPTTKTAVEKMEHAGLVKHLSGKYSVADKLSLTTLRQLAKVDEQRLKDNRVFDKKTGSGMRKKIEPFEGMKIAPQKYLEAHVARAGQLVDKENNRLLSAVVIGDGDNVLLISSSKKPNDWILPKGGWDHGEGIEKAALREVIEEAGIQARLNHDLGKFTYKDGDKGYGLFAYTMDDVQRFDDWAESSRYRIDILEAAEKKNALVKRGDLPKRDPQLENVNLT
ncbi:hypothetical protein PInf_009948 [Phytophthora infestans]|nr:hypothetical protein PInf_009948 [Phytophthora infestans]